jgi:hypothetical protein
MSDSPHNNNYSPTHLSSQVERAGDIFLARFLISPEGPRAARRRPAPRDHRCCAHIKQALPYIINYKCTSCLNNEYLERIIDNTPPTCTCERHLKDWVSFLSETLPMAYMAILYFSVTRGHLRMCLGCSCLRPRQAWCRSNNGCLVRDMSVTMEIGQEITFVGKLKLNVATLCQ